MRNKIITSLFILSILFLITGCEKNNKFSKSNNKENLNSNSVVLYFSAIGTTKKIAERIAKESNSDIIEIIPKEEYKPEE